ncbi:MAG: hypothetical protein EXR28_07950 [Betaproteobacteria bacterium]|nr:hypothetical protein [Betaproteobacteria bacterium]
MTTSIRARRRPVALSAAVFALLTWSMAVIAPAAACEFDVVKKHIDEVLDRDKDKGAVFRREVATGSDSIAMMEKLAPPKMREQIDICRFHVAEYLTKRGYPPAH